MTFIGRKTEVQTLNQFLDREYGAALIYGKRKVGKNTLIKFVLQNRRERFVYFECLKNTVRENLDAFVSELVRSQILPVKVTFSGFPDLFAYLNTLQFPLTVVIDEYPYLKTMTAPEIIDSAFQNIIDNRLENIHLILLGSHVGMMKDMFAEGNALYGRFRTVLHIQELPYWIADSFCGREKAYDKAAFYSIFGGFPYVLEKIDPSASLLRAQY